MSLEVTTAIPCPVGCRKYCPQEVIAKRYKGAKMLSVETFEKCLSNCPPSMPVAFAGFSEPFTNPHFMQLLELAAEHHPIALFTTLMGASPEDASKLCKHKYIGFCLHLPDGEIFKMPQNPSYKDAAFKVITGIPNLRFDIMNECFTSNYREDVTRGVMPQKKRFGYCMKIEMPNPVLVPNGDVYLCCMDFGLETKLGNLLTDSFENITEKIKHSNGFPICQYCSYNIPLLRRYAQVTKLAVRNMLNWQ